MTMRMFFPLLLLLINPIDCRTTIETYPQLNLKENLPIRTKIFDFKTKNLNDRRMKITLLNVNGYENDLFEVNDNDNELITRQEIDREEFLELKRCFDPMFCLFELHFLINDGEKYSVLPIHLIDENDNRPEFYSREMNFRFDENVIDGYQMYLNGAKDLDEGIHQNINYYLSCSLKPTTTKKFLWNENNEKIHNDENCFGIFELNFIGKSSFFSSNQFDQLSIKYSKENYLKKKSAEKINEFNLIVFAFDRNENEMNVENVSSMKIRLTIVETERKVIEEKKIVVWDALKKADETIFLFRSKFELNLFSNQSEMFVLNSMKNEISIRKKFLVDQIETKIFLFPTKHFDSLVKIVLFHCEKEKFEKIFLRNSFVEIDEEKLRRGIPIEIVSEFYRDDLFRLKLKNNVERFFLEEKQNEYFLRGQMPNETIQLNLTIEHRFSNENFLDRQIKLIVNLNETSSSLFCEENSRSSLFQLDGQWIGDVLHLNSSSFNEQNSTIEQMNDEILVYRQCSMKIDSFVQRENNSSIYFCQKQSKTIDSTLCEKIRWIDRRNSIVDENWKIKSFWNENFLLFPIVLFSVTLILSIIFIFICCSTRRTSATSICLRMKTYLFLGKKYRLSQIQRLSQTKINSRIESIVIKECQSNPTIENLTIRPSSSISPLYFASSSFPMLFDQTILTQNDSNDSTNSSTHFHLDVSRLASEV